ncbi:Glycosyl transferase family 2 [Pseudobythopirellula maris]|uniref:Glycosyl transferase family 2 n=1 Tax=Pseudobythopirellula maris TaxID=2527991 RepID=A0A5C5ZM69_9BACT|nr:glycosyltransferase family A protein [Pseudobythopirellula maris]TWT87533.1 Glycosyl transferase family 2 [Pseudobythopirellula maris]
MSNQPLTDPPSLLLITWNRHAYAAPTIARLLEDPSDFRLYLWDNDSRDGVRDLITGLQDPRIVERHLHHENVGQFEPWRWFLEASSGDVLGKIDDDVLLPAGWTQQFTPLLREDDRAGMLGCWIFMPEDWDASAADQNSVEVAGNAVLRMTSIAGHSFLAQRDTLERYTYTEARGHGLPVDRIQMSLDGYVSGVPLPPQFAHNMDDPRSPHFHREHGAMGQSSLTARCLELGDEKRFGEWIAGDASFRLRTPYEAQMRRLERRRRLDDRTGLRARIERKLLRMTRKW